MSEATATADGERLSGRALALARRQALSQGGKNGLSGGAKPGGSATAARMAARAAESSTPPAAAARPAPTAVVEEVQCGCEHENGAAGRSEPITPEPPSIARQRRIQQSLNGRGDRPACRPCGRVRPEPQKVEVGSTLSGTPVTGTQVERTPRVTGNEYGACRPITGTEYIGAEQYSRFCGTVPEPRPAKVGVSSTSRGRRITGTELGRSPKVTGDEPGSCKRVTGSDYLAAERIEEFCATTPEPHPEKVGVGVTAKRITITGSDLNRRARVTGAEAGAGRLITGTAYNDVGVAPAGTEDAPKKVVTSHTAAGRPVSGTQVGRSGKVTGDEHGECKRVTGTEYISSEQFQTICRAEPYQSPAKVNSSRTWHRQEVTGTLVGRSAKVTGDEYGACKPVTGASYIGAEQYQGFCAPGETEETASRTRALRATPGPVLTGTQPGVDGKMTGAERGACQAVSGTPYVGEDQFTAACGTLPMAAARARHHRAQGPQGAPLPHALTGSVLAGGTGFQPGDFSITTPARAAQSRQVSRITGTAYGAAGRITGPMARGTGLVSGTPEFRYRDDQAPPLAPPAVPVERITGEGRERRITGDAWDRGERVTGTEGLSATRRNMTLRREARGEGRNARVFQAVERPEPAKSRITGSSGNTTSGAVVTLSGGARG